MSKKGIILLTIIAFFIVLTAVLFSTVFCLRTQNVLVVGDTPIVLSKKEIIETAGLKKGESIFMLDKEKATNNIETKYPNIKVVHIKTKSITEIEIQVRARHEMCYAIYNNSYYVLDEELKVLDIIENDVEATEEINEITQLTRIEAGLLNIKSTTKICNFVGNKLQKTTMSKLYLAMITTVTKTEGSGDEEHEVYLTRSDVCDMIKEVSFEEHETYNKILIKTKYGVVLDVENPSKQLQHKINICFSTIKALIDEGENKEKSGTIKIYYDIENHQKCIYIPSL